MLEQKVQVTVDGSSVLEADSLTDEEARTLRGELEEAVQVEKVLEPLQDIDADVLVVKVALGLSVEDVEAQAVDAVGRSGECFRLRNFLMSITTVPERKHI